MRHRARAVEEECEEEMKPDKITFVIEDTFVEVAPEGVSTHYRTGGIQYPISIEFEAKGKRYKGWIREDK